MTQIEKDLRIRSHVISEGENRAPNRAMLRAVGFTDDDFKKPMIGIASTWSEVTPCNMHIDQLAVEAKRGGKRWRWCTAYFQYDYSFRRNFNGPCWNEIFSAKP